MLNSLRCLSPHYFLSRNEEKRLSDAIDVFESRTGCELVFHFRKKLGDSPLKRVEELFHHFGLHKTKHRSTIMVVLSFQDRKYAVWADENVNRKSKDELWTRAGQVLSEKLKNKHRLDSLLAFIQAVEPVLAQEVHSNLKTEDRSVSNKPITEEE